ncbi:hypothetical protein LP414_27465 [Polaromonas sp. P1(28)-13]|nr:hypothetical protein LP414_27465 [Polaromonas sp. P1(28)-13]
MPNFELLKDAYAIIGGIPKNVIDLDQIEKQRGKSLSCGTICCAAGWLGHHPMFKAKGLSVLENGSLAINGEHVWYEEAMAKIFDIPVRDAESLFGSTYNMTDGNSKKSHKQIWLKRMRDYLRGHGQLKAQLAGQ